MLDKKNNNSRLTPLERCRLLLAKAEDSQTKTDTADVHDDGETLVATAHPSKKNNLKKSISPKTR